ncbi:hypothetical protein [Nocardiopsis sp. LOL_012]|uniref:hypothetical protein n=1 Tax=Nocardiopsis sp. LOL_012 TaxID=3345409 RepID=UPI003A8A8601
MPPSGDVRGALLRGILVVGGAAVLSVAAITGGLVLAADETEVPAGDVHTSAPSCSAVPAAAVEEALPGALPETVASGPLPDGENTVCAWTSLGRSETPGTLRVEFSVLLTDTEQDTPLSGTEHAGRLLAALAPEHGHTVELSSGPEAHVWLERVSGTADLAFRSDNLLVRLSYADTAGSGPDQAEQAREAVVAFAERLAEAL